MTILVILTGIITLIASAATFISGFGLSTILTGSLSYVLPLTTLVILIAPIHAAHSLWKALLYMKSISWKITLVFGIPAMIMSYWGAQLLIHASDYIHIRQGLGAFLILYALALLIRPSLQINSSYPMLVLVGLLTGFFAGIFGVRGAIRSVALSAYNLKKENYIATSGIIGLLVDSTRMISYWNSNAIITIDRSLQIALPLFIILSFVGAVIGRTIVKHVSPKTFRFVIAMFLLVAGLRLLIQSPNML